MQRVILSGLGGPLAHPRVLEIVRLARERGMAVTIGSTGLLLDRAMSRDLVGLGADRLVVSLDGVKSETYARARCCGLLGAG